jgi:lipopolysaccharide/colanic/teichoic acid biosynthesis glycosyltransferase
MRRILDIVVSLVSLVLLAIPFLLIAVAIKLSSRGPVFFLQRRVGRGGKLFWLYKFRSMRVDNSGPQITPHGDPRITRIGRFLRQSKCDELPQMWNVLRGDMSLIGPRPEVERFVQHYTPEQRGVLDIKPGLAGIAQLVYQHEAELLEGHPEPEQAYIRYFMPAKVAADLEYEKRRTWWSDLVLMVDIALAIFGYNRRRDRSFKLPPAQRSGSGSPAVVSEV